jgi:glycine betaine catabolism B
MDRQGPPVQPGSASCLQTGYRATKTLIDLMLQATAPASSSVLAFVTTVHAGLFLLRAHSGRRGGWVLALPSALLAGLTWVLNAPAWLVTSLAANVAWFTACQFLAPAIEDQTLDAAEAAHRFVALQVLESRDECSTIRTIRLSRPPGFDFEAGQFLTVQVELGGRKHVRCYSISSAPDVPDHLEISVRRQGLVSGLLHARVRTGGQLLARRPAGRFVYPSDNGRPVVLLAGGIGITPLIAMVRHAVAAEPQRPLTLLYSVRHAGDIAFRDELARLAHAHPLLRVLITVTGGTPGDGLRHGRIDAAAIRESVADPTGAVYLICGPLAMIEGAKALLADVGVPASQVRFEAFEAAAAVGAKVPGAGEAGTERRLKLARSRVDATVSPGESLLEAAERAGAEIPSVCRAGVCGACRTRLVSGSARCTSATLAPVEREKGFVLPCVTWADGDCVLEA